MCRRTGMPAEAWSPRGRPQRKSSARRSPRAVTRRGTSRHRRRGRRSGRRNDRGQFGCHRRRLARRGQQPRDPRQGTSWAGGRFRFRRAGSCVRGDRDHVGTVAFAVIQLFVFALTRDAAIGVTTIASVGAAAWLYIVVRRLARDGRLVAAVAACSVALLGSHARGRRHAPRRRSNRCHAAAAGRRGCAAVLGSSDAALGHGRQSGHGDRASRSRRSCSCRRPPCRRAPWRSSACPASSWARRSVMALLWQFSSRLERRARADGVGQSRGSRRPRSRSAT